VGDIFLGTCILSFNQDLTRIDSFDITLCILLLTTYNIHSHHPTNQANHTYNPTTTQVNLTTTTSTTKTPNTKRKECPSNKKATSPTSPATNK
jgi:hypothetical protein